MTKNKNTKTSQIHIPVMSDKVLETLNPKRGEAYLDLTAGYGGHANQVLERTLELKKTVLVDRDQMAIDQLAEKFQGSGIRIIHKDFLNAAKELLQEKRTFDIVLADLGVSSPHLNTASRGFSFRYDAPLDMRMDQRQELTADYVVNTYKQKELEAILREYGEEPKARQIASLLVENRPIYTTTKLAEIVAQAWPGYSRVHPATRTFQALRIVVNDELRLVKETLPIMVKLLAPGGRLAIITFHSLEDRIVKRYFSGVAGDRYDTDIRLLTKKPIIPSQNELVLNPRSRSAKLRAVAKIKNKKKGDA
jgi:16S rRNA (cytosine1402-N4)-methyltransferase